MNDRQRQMVEALLGAQKQQTYARRKPAGQSPWAHPSLIYGPKAPLLNWHNRLTGGVARPGRRPLI